jgi:hypothetical protein
MASAVAPRCPVHSEFDPLSPHYLQDPFAVMSELPARETPVFYAPAIDWSGAPASSRARLIDIHDEDPEALTLDEIASICFSLSFAGHETTTDLIGNVMRRLLEDRARWERVVADAEAIPGAVEETLRRLGSALGKLEAELAVAELARRWPELALVEGQEFTFHPTSRSAGRRRCGSPRWPATARSYEAGTTAANAAGGADVGVRRSTLPLAASRATTAPSCA